ncbi:hypothetical protein D3C73_509480 [compost metagenome]
MLGVPVTEPLASDKSVKAVIPDGAYLAEDSNDLEQQHNHIGNFLVQSNYRVDHHHFYYYIKVDLILKTMITYIRLRNNGLDLTTLPHESDAHTLQLKNAYMDAFAHQRSATLIHYTHPTLDEKFGEICFSYLWDNLVSSDVISPEELRDYAHVLDQVYFFWDAHPNLSLLWSLGRTHMYKMNYSSLLDHYFARNLSDDMYICDESMTWTLILTHEPQNELDWRFLRIGIVSDSNKNQLVK